MSKGATKAVEIVIGVDFESATYKLCPACQQIRRKTEFGRDRRRYNGLTLRCRDCHRRFRSERRTRAEMPLLGSF